MTEGEKRADEAKTLEEKVPDEGPGGREVPPSTPTHGSKKIGPEGMTESAASDFEGPQGGRGISGVVQPVG